MVLEFLDKKVVRVCSLPIKANYKIEDLKKLCSTARFQEAIYLASPTLYNQLKLWTKGRDLGEKKEKKLILSIFKYALRMSNRTTPFGLFAGCSVSDFDKSILNINSDIYYRKTRIDMNFISVLVQYIVKNTVIRNHLIFFTNTSIYGVSDKLRYVESFYKDKNRYHKISEVENDDYLNRVINLAKNGKTKLELVDSLVDGDVSHQEANEFIDELIDSQIVTSELEPTIIGDNQFGNIISILDKIIQKERNQDLISLISILKEVETNIKKIDSGLTANPIDYYENIYNSLLGIGLSFDKNKLFQTDIYFENQVVNHSESHLSKTQLSNALTALNILSPEYDNLTLKEFKKKFYDRYEDRVVPVSEVFDTDIGIGYSINKNSSGNYCPLIDNIPVGYDNGAPVRIPNSENNDFLFKILLEANVNKKLEFEINLKDLKDQVPNWNNYPSTTFCLVKEVVKNGEVSAYVNMVGGSSAANLIGRFASGNKEINAIFDSVIKLEKEFYCDSVVASLTHLPEGRTGNILNRSKTRDFEIPYLVKPTSTEEKQIRISDLFLFLHGEELILFSNKLKKRILPRLDNAHNYVYKSLPIYQFLCDIQCSYPQKSMFIDFNKFGKGFNFHPRLVVDNIVISPATWKFSISEMKSIFDHEDWKNKILEFKDKWSLPEVVLLMDDDNFLPIDFSNNLSLELFKNESKKMKVIHLKEYEFNTNTSTLCDSLGNNYANENLYFLQKNLKEKNTNKNIFANIIENDRLIRRKFTIGSEWIFFKIYCGSKTADWLLPSIILDLSKQLIENGGVDTWFFIRYADPENHIRLRFHLTKNTTYDVILKKVNSVLDKYITDGVIWRLSIDQYDREVERYGKDTMDICEQIFNIDSINTLEFLNMIEDDEGEEYRWLYSLSKINTFLDCFDFSTENKLELIERLKNAFDIEFKTNKVLNKYIDLKYRSKKEPIEKFIEFPDFMKKEFPELVLLTNTYKVKIMSIIKINKMLLSKVEKHTLNRIIESCIHMMLNRLFINEPRMHELMIYNFLYRNYKSQYMQTLSHNRSV